MQRTIVPNHPSSYLNSLKTGSTIPAFAVMASVLLFLGSQPAEKPSTASRDSGYEPLGKRDSIVVGSEAPPFVMRNLLTDEPTFLKDYTGKTLREAWKKKERNVVVISFWATWCQPCKIEIPLLTKMAEEFKTQPVKIFLVNTLEKEPTTEDTVRAIYASRGYTLPCLLDASSRFSQLYTVYGLPFICVIDKFGIVRKINRGYHENFYIDVANLVKELVKADSVGTK